MDDDFAAYHPLLMGVAYRVLGRVVEAEDVVQEAWLRWTRTDRAEVAEPAAFLVRVTTRLAIDRLRRIKARPETPAGTWLPEPLLTGPDVADDVVRAESVSMALLVVLETLSPLERAVFVLRDCFDVPYEEIAGTIGRNPAAVRQLAARARAHVSERRPRFEIDQSTRQAVTDTFFQTCVTGDLESLIALLAPGVSYLADGGGRAKAARRVIVGPSNVARFIWGILHHIGLGPFLESVGLPPATPIAFDVVQANGGPAGIIVAGGRPVAFIQVDVADGLVQRVYHVADPLKMSGLMSQDGRVLRQ